MNDNTMRFSDRVSNYSRYRPSYPQSAFDFIQKEFGEIANSVVADIGSGTGIFTQQLIPYVGLVYAVEPNAEMRSQAEARLSGESKFRSINGTSDRTGLPDGRLDIVFAAQAAHWFDLPKTKIEFKRILKPRGRVVFLWNRRRSVSDFLRSYDAFVKSIPGASEASHENVTEETLRDFLGSEMKSKSFENSQRFDLKGLIGRFASSSYTPAEGTRAYAEAVDFLEDLFRRYSVDSEVRFEYETQIFVGSVSD